jgi:ribonuclease HII
MRRVLGLDEAGRGCVLGPLVVGAFLVDEDGIDALKEAGATDSKKLSAKKRESLIAPLGLLGQARVLEVSAVAIDGGNMNTLEEHAFADHIEHFRPDHVIIDAPVHPRGIPNFLDRLRALLTYEPTILAEPKADLNYPPCGAASIFAKVQRDARIKALGPVGSGYPSDPVTRAWLRGFFEREEPLPDCVRTRWDTLRKLREETAQRGLFS